MISVLIPYLAYPPYTEQIDVVLDDLSKQTADLEIHISEQPVVGKHDRICKGKLHNRGFAESLGDIIFHCDADIRFHDETLLERMESKLREDDLDVIYPMFWSDKFKIAKLADGHPFMTREVREEYGPLNESDLGTSLQEFRILEWLYFNKKFHCSEEFMFHLNLLPFTKNSNDKHKIDIATKKECVPIANRVVKELTKEGLWPDVLFAEAIQ
jgi:glycosyltransferase involved in cell wall biosynthesis